MQNIKEEVIDIIKTLPDEVSLEEIMSEIYFKIQVDEGIKDLDEGRYLTQEEFEKRMSKKII